MNRWFGISEAVRILRWLWRHIFTRKKFTRPKSAIRRTTKMTAKRRQWASKGVSALSVRPGKQFKATAASGTYGPRVDMTLDEADKFVALYRQDNPSICARGTGYWAQCERMLARLAGGDPIDYGPVHIENHRIYLQGRPMIYDTIEYHTPQIGRGKPQARLARQEARWLALHLGSKLLQNLCEGIETVIISQAMTRIKKKYGIRTLNWPYDELLLLIPRNGREEEMLALCKAEMVVEPSWLPGLPLACDGSLSDRYEK